MKSFVNSVRLEFLKTKNSTAFWFTFFAAFFIPLIQFLICVLRPEIFVPKIQPSPWKVFTHANWKQVATIILPLFVILVNSLLLQVEFRNNTWKQVYTMPKSYSEIFFSKLLVTQCFIFFFLFLFSFAIIISGISIELCNREYGFALDTIPWMELLKTAIGMYLVTLPVAILQFGLSGKYKNFIIPLASGLLLWITGLVIADWEQIHYYPYIYSTLLFFSTAPGHVDETALLIRFGLLWAGLFLLVCFLENYYKKERG